MENINFILKFITFSYIKNLLEIVVKLKIKKCLPSSWISIFIRYWLQLGNHGCLVQVIPTVYVPVDNHGCQVVVGHVTMVGRYRW